MAGQENPYAAPKSSYAQENVDFTRAKSGCFSLLTLPRFRRKELNMHVTLPTEEVQEFETLLQMIGNSEKYQRLLAKYPKTPDYNSPDYLCEFKDYENMISKHYPILFKQTNHQSDVEFVVFTDSPRIFHAKGTELLKLPKQRLGYYWDRNYLMKTASTLKQFVLNRLSASGDFNLEKGEIIITPARISNEVTAIKREIFSNFQKLLKEHSIT